MQNFPTYTANKNVPPRAFLIYQYEQCSGEIVTTCFSDGEGTLWRVTDWSGNKPTMISIDDVANEMGLTPLYIMQEIVKHAQRLADS